MMEVLQAQLQGYQGPVVQSIVSSQNVNCSSKYNI